MSLKARTLNGFFWSLSQQFGIQAISTLVTIFLARILNPEDFGLIGMLMIFMALGNSLVDAGLTSSLIRTQDADQRDFSTVFYINLIGSVFAYLLMYAFSKPISVFFNQPILESIIKIYCLSFIITAFSTVQRTRLVKKLDFKTELKVVMPSVIISGVTGITLAMMGFGVWALVWMALAQHFFTSIQFWIYSGWRPSMIFDKNRFKYHFEYGYKMTLSGIINSLFSNLYLVVIGKYFSLAQLGFYAKADSLKQIPVKNISTTLSKVTFPMFSEIQGDDAKLKVVYKRVMQQVLFWLTPVMVLAAVLAEPVFRLVLTEKWVPAVPYFQLLCFIGLMYPIHSYNLNILKVKGRSDLYLRLEIIKKTLTVIGIIIALPFGIFALLWAQIFLNIVAFGINSYFSGKFIGYDLISQVKDILPIFAIGFLSGIGAFVVRDILLDFQILDVFQIFLGGILGLMVYFSVSWVFKSEALLDFRKIVLKK
jgi:teichuronic acid exporter